MDPSPALRDRDFTKGPMTAISAITRDRGDLERDHGQKERTWGILKI